MACYSISACVHIVDTCTLRNVVLGCGRKFEVNNLILDGSQVVDILVVLSRFEVFVE